MVLKTNSLPAQTANPGATARPAFEAMDDDTVSTVAQADTAAANDAPAAAAAPAPAPAPAPQTSAVVVAGAPNAGASFAAQVTAMRDVFEFNYKDFKEYKANGGDILCSETDDNMGRWVHGTMLGWGENTQISPKPDNPAAKDFVAYSKGGLTVDSVIGEDQAGWVGKPVAEYLQFLRADAGYRLSEANKYVQVAFAVLDAEGSKKMVGEVVQVTLNPSSIPSFSSYQTQLKAKGLAGLKLPENPFTFYFSYIQGKNKEGKTWPKLEVLTKLPTRA